MTLLYYNILTHILTHDLFSFLADEPSLPVTEEVSGIDNNLYVNIEKFSAPK